MILVTSSGSVGAREVNGRTFLRIEEESAWAALKDSGSLSVKEARSVEILEEKYCEMASRQVCKEG